MSPLGARLGVIGLALGLLACGSDSFAPTAGTVAVGMTLTLTLAPDGTTSGRLFLAGGGDNGVDLDENLSGTWSLSGRTVTFDQAADTFVRDADFTAGPRTLTTAGTFGDVTLRLVLTKTG